MEDEAGPKIKLSPGKKTYPGKKQIYRITDSNGYYTHDILALDHENVDGFPLLECVVKDGKRVQPRKSLQEIQQYSRECVDRLKPELKKTRVLFDHPVVLSYELSNVVDELTKKYSVGQPEKTFVPIMEPIMFEEVLG